MNSTAALALMNEIIAIIIGGLQQLGAGIGTALSSIATSIFLTGTGDAQTLSVFGVLIAIFAGVSLAFSLCYLVFNFIKKWGN